MTDKRYTTELLVLKKSIFQDTSLIVNGFSKNEGKIDFILKNALSIKKNKYPVIDLFREVKVELKHNDGRFQAIYSAELLNNYDSIVNFSDNLNSAYLASKFLLKNIQPLIPYSATYAAVKKALNFWSQNKNSTLPYLSIIKFVFFYENGILPEVNKEQADWFNTLLNFATGKGKLPEISKEYWDSFSEWINQIN